MARISTLACFTVSGEILSEDIISQFSIKNCGIEGSEIVEDDFIAGYDLLYEQWQKIRNEIQDYDADKRRRSWFLPVLDYVLDFKRQHQKSHIQYAENRTIPINYRHGNIPIWVLDYGQDLDTKLETGRRKLSPHEHMQEYLDLTDDDWGIIFNGKVIRLLHDYRKSLTRSYVEADIEAIFESLDLDAFRVVWRIFHSSRFEKDTNGNLIIELLHDASRKQGLKVGDELRGQVRKAVETLGNGFLSANSDGILMETLQNDSSITLEYYKCLLRIVYRILFLLFIENRPNPPKTAELQGHAKWTPADDPIWAESYSISRIREFAEQGNSAYREGYDLWEGVKIICNIIRDGNERFGIHPYGGELFDDDRISLIKDFSLSNADLINVVGFLTSFEKDNQVQRINFKTLDIEALGSIYEGLMDSTALIFPDGKFGFVEGTERKLTGSYYTPKELVAELIKSALVPVIEERLSKANTKKDKENAILEIKVVDPACGSGAFLIQAMDKLAQKLLEVRLEGESPSDLDIREARRQVVRHCIHGVDMNPLAVDLCRFVLWLNVAHPSFPLSYLEPLIKCGNSLIGIPMDSQVIRAKEIIEKEKKMLVAQGKVKDAQKLEYVGWPKDIPDEAYVKVTGDDADVSKSIKASNKTQREGHLSFTESFGKESKELTVYYDDLRDVSDSDVKDINHAKELYSNYLDSSEYKHSKLLADAWCSAFFWKLEYSNRPPTTQDLRMLSNYRADIQKKDSQQIFKLSNNIGFFHWQLEFPDVFKNGGFDCVLGNPPWERIKLLEKEFFASRDPEIAAAVNAAERGRLIRKLSETNPDLLVEFEFAKFTAEATSRFIRQCRKYPLTASGDINLYAIFAEHFISAISSNGQCGFICPTGIATDFSTKDYFSYISDNNLIRSIYDFENKEALFEGVHRSFKFCLFTASGDSNTEPAKFVYWMTNPSHLDNETRWTDVTPDDIALINPNTHTSPVFRTKQDAILTIDIYKRVPVLVNEIADENPWGTSFLRMIDMSNDSKLFTSEPADDRLRLYESKMIHHYNHRFGSYEGVEGTSSSNLPTPDEKQYQDPYFIIQPRYWVEEEKVDEKLEEWSSYKNNWLVGYRNISNVTNERTFISAVIPKVGVGNSMPIFSITQSTMNSTGLTCNLSLIVFDYITRQKIGGTNINFFYVNQFPVLPPIAYSSNESLLYIVPRVLELTYTSWDIKAFADDLWNEADDELKNLIKKQWEDNKAATGGHTWNPPKWAEIDECGIPLPPFKWDKDRRANLKAELDAYYARLYGLNRKQLRYILDPHGLSWKELEDILDPWEEPSCTGAHLIPDYPAIDFPGETFRVLKNNDERDYGEYRTRCLILEAWDKLEKELGTVEQINYREMLKEQPKKHPPIIEKKKIEPIEKDLELVMPEPAQPKLKIDTPPPPTGGLKANENSRRIIIIDKPGILLNQERMGNKTKVYVQFDGEDSPRAFLIPPATMEFID